MSLLATIRSSRWVRFVPIAGALGYLWWQSRDAKHEVALCLVLDDPSYHELDVRLNAGSDEVYAARISVTKGRVWLHPKLSKGNYALHAVARGGEAPPHDYDLSFACEPNDATSTTLYLTRRAVGTASAAPLLRAPAFSANGTAAAPNQPEMRPR
jgi:hypothetical protein